MSIINNITIFPQIAQAGISASQFVGDYRTIQISVTATGVTDGFSVRFPGSTRTSARLVDTRPEFRNDSSPENAWNYIGFSGLTDFVNYDGDTGAVIAEDGTYLYNIETVGLIWMGCEIFDYTDGSVTVEVTVVDRYLN